LPRAGGGLDAAAEGRLRLVKAPFASKEWSHAFALDREYICFIHNLLF